MKRWGAAGNSASAQLLSTFLAESGIARCDVIYADDLLAVFDAAGRQIRQITRSTFGESLLGDRYRSCLEELDTRLPGDSGALRPLYDELRRRAPDCVIATKGVIARMVDELRRSGGLPVPLLVNYVTNHGHFEMPIHRCHGADVHVVRLPRGVGALQAALPGARRVVRVPYLTASPDAAPPCWGESDRANAVVVVNRGADFFARVVKELAQRPEAEGIALHVLCVDVDSEDALSTIEGCRDRFHSVRLVPKLGPAAYGRELCALAATPTVLLTKASPNAIAEAIRLCLPLVVVPSGLPMEDWVTSWVLDLGVGQVATGPANAAEALATIATRVSARRSYVQAACDAQRHELLAISDGVGAWNDVLSPEMQA